LRVQKLDQSIVEYPLVEAVIGSVDVAAGRVTLLDAEGL
jgi:ribosomal 30S subunit maturation factor RimM